MENANLWKTYRRTSEYCGFEEGFTFKGRPTPSGDYIEDENGFSHMVQNVEEVLPEVTPEDFKVGDKVVFYGSDRETEVAAIYGDYLWLVLDTTLATFHKDNVEKVPEGPKKCYTVGDSVVMKETYEEAVEFQQIAYPDSTILTWVLQEEDQNL